MIVGKEGNKADIGDSPELLRGNMADVSYIDMGTGNRLHVPLRYSSLSQPATIIREEEA